MMYFFRTAQAQVFPKLDRDAFVGHRLVLTRNVHMIYDE